MAHFFNEKDLQLCWNVATQKKFTDKLTKEVNCVNTIALCNKIENNFLIAKGKSRSSLCLSSNFIFGAVKILQTQVEICLKDVENLIMCNISNEVLITFKKKRKVVKKISKNANSKKVNSPVEVIPESPQISETKVLNSLEKDSKYDNNLIMEVDFPPSCTGELSFEYSTNAETEDSLIIIKELNDEMQRILQLENNPEPGPSTDFPISENANDESPYTLDNDNIRDKDQVSLNDNNLRDMQQQSLKTPIRKARSQLITVNSSAPENMLSVNCSPLQAAGHTLSLPLDVSFTMSPVFGKRKRRTKRLGRDVTIVEPTTTAALPTDSPLQSQLPMDCNSPPRQVSTVLKEQEAFEPPSENHPEVSRQSIPEPEENNENTELEIGEFINESVLDNENILSAQNECSIDVESQPLTAKSNRSRKKKIPFKDLNTSLNIVALKKVRHDVNYQIKRKEDALILTSNFMAVSNWLNFPSIMHQVGCTSNCLGQLYNRSIELRKKFLKKTAKETSQSQRSNQHSEYCNRNYNEKVRYHQSPSERNKEKQINQHLSNSLMTQHIQDIQDNDLIPQPGGNELEIPYYENDIISNTAASILHTPTRADSSQMIEPDEVVLPHRNNPRQLFESLQNVEINNDLEDNPEDNLAALHKTKKGKFGNIEARTVVTVQNGTENSVLSLSDFYAKIQAFWSEAKKCNKRKNGKIIAVFQEIASPKCTSVCKCVKYLKYCFSLEQQRQLLLLQEKPFDPLFIMQWNE